MAVGALEGALASQYSGGSYLAASGIGAGTGLVGSGLVVGYQTSKEARKDGLPILGFAMGGILGGGKGAIRGAWQGPAAMAIAAATGTGTVGGAVAGALLASF